MYYKHLIKFLNHPPESLYISICWEHVHLSLLIQHFQLGGTIFFNNIWGRHF